MKTKLSSLSSLKSYPLTQANKRLGIYELSTGGLTETIVNPRLIFAAALKANACSMILSHNHPSDNLKPNRQDEEMTQRIKRVSFPDITCQTFAREVLSKTSEKQIVE